MGSVVSLTPFEQANNDGRLYLVSTDGDVADAGVLNILLKPPAGLNARQRLRGRIVAGAETGGFVVRLRTTPSSNSGGSVFTPVNLNQNVTTGWGGQTCKTGVTYGGGTLLLVSEVLGFFQSPPLELAADVNVVVELTNSSGATARASLSVVFEMV